MQGSNTVNQTKVPYPENSDFYVSNCKDVWSANHNEKLCGTKKKDVDGKEIDAFSKAIAGHMPWQDGSQTVVRDTNVASSSRACLDDAPKSPSYPIKASPSPSPSPPLAARVKREGGTASYIPQVEPAPNADPEYNEAVSQLVVSIHKTAGEWFRKSREYGITVLKSASHDVTKGSNLERALSQAIADGNEAIASMDDVEKKYVVGENIPHTRQVEIKRSIADINDLVKNANKIKLR